VRLKAGYSTREKTTSIYLDWLTVHEFCSPEPPGGTKTRAGIGGSKIMLDIFLYRNALYGSWRERLPLRTLLMLWRSRGRERYSTIWLSRSGRWGEIVDALEMERPSVSKHLRVLKEVGLVHARKGGMFDRTNAETIRPLDDWAETFERYWQHQLIRVKERAEEKSGAVKKD
jgi:DNA-binding transcriptional ArsR family regulator